MEKQDLQDRALTIVKERRGITFDVLLYAVGLTRDGYRVLDKVLQNMRKKGLVRFAGPKVGWVAGEEKP